MSWSLPISILQDASSSEDGAALAASPDHDGSAALSAIPVSEAAVHYELADIPVSEGPEHDGSAASAAFLPPTQMWDAAPADSWPSFHNVTLRRPMPLPVCDSERLVIVFKKWLWHVDQYLVRCSSVTVAIHSHDIAGFAVACRRRYPVAVLVED